MNKLVSYLIGLAITIVIMYVVGFIIASILAVFIFIIKKFIAYRNSKIQFTEWEYDSEYPPQVTYKDGEGYFQNKTCYRKYNRFEEKWEFKTVVDPVKRSFSEEKSLSDSFYLSKR